MKALLTVCAALAMMGAANAAQANRYLRKPPPQGLHLYLSAGLAGGGRQVLRYALVNGFPVQSPDLVYAGVGSPTAVGRDGTFYASEPLDSSFGQQVIDAFLPGSPTPARRITLPVVNDSTFATSLTVGPGGYLYAGYDSFISGARIPAPDNGSSGSLPTHGIAVYAPTANGSGPPLLAFRFAGLQSGAQALAFDAQQHLHASGSGFHHGKRLGFVLNIADPQTAPKLVSRIELGSTDPVGMECSDDGENIYVLTSGGPSDTTSTVLVFPRQAFGPVAPSRTMQLADNAGTAVAIAGPYLYTNLFQFRAPNELLAYPKHGSGSPPPVFVRTYQTLAIGSVSIGP